MNEENAFLNREIALLREENSQKDNKDDKGNKENSQKGKLHQEISKVNEVNARLAGERVTYFSEKLVTAQG